MPLSTVYQLLVYRSQQTSRHNVVLHMSVVISIDCVGICETNINTIPSTVGPNIWWIRVLMYQRCGFESRWRMTNIYQLQI